ncbi:MAG: nucleotidyltransferase family protein [Mycobacteriales bacterium]
MSDTDRWLRWVAAYGLPGSLVERPTEVLVTSAWKTLLTSVRRHHLLGLLWHAIEDDQLPVTLPQRDEVAREHIQVMGGVLRLEAQLLRVVRALQDEGIETRVLKGSAVAHLDYPDPALRPFGDVDLLVRSDDFDAAVAALKGTGLPRAFSEPRPGFDRRYGKGASFRGDKGFELDLHRTFVIGPFGVKIKLDSLWETRSTFALAGTQLHALGGDERFLNACYSAAISDAVPRMATQRDLAQMLLFGGVDRRRVRELAKDWGAEVVLARAVLESWRALQIADVTGLSSWAFRYRPEAHDKRDVALYTTPGVSYTAQSLATFGAIRGVRPRLRFVLSLSAPRREFSEPSQRGFTGRLLKGAHDLVEARARS